MYLKQLERYAAQATAAGYHAWVLPADETKPVAELLCLIEVDERDRDYVLQLIYANELSESQGIKRSDKELIFLQCMMTLPFPVAAGTQADTARLLHVLNLLVPIGQFILNDPEQKIVFRGVLPHVNEAIDPWLVVEAINMMKFFIMRFSTWIEAVATGASTYAQTLQALHEQGERLLAPAH